MLGNLRNLRDNLLFWSGRSKAPIPLVLDALAFRSKVSAAATAAARLPDVQVHVCGCRIDFSHAELPVFSVPGYLVQWGEA